jgi:hypothetical protein
MRRDRQVSVLLRKDPFRDSDPLLMMRRMDKIYDLGYHAVDASPLPVTIKEKAIRISFNDRRGLFQEDDVVP